MKIYDSKVQGLVDFVPIKAGQVGIYICGPTVQSAPHLGHLRSAVAFDIVARWLSLGHGLEVRVVRNITDVDDKILANASEQGVDWRDLAKSVEKLFQDSFLALDASVQNEPRATSFIPEMIAMIERLIERGHAYKSDTGTANVFFSTSSHQAYGELTNQRLENMEGEAIGGGRR